MPSTDHGRIPILLRHIQRDFQVTEMSSREGSEKIDRECVSGSAQKQPIVLPIANFFLSSGCPRRLRVPIESGCSLSIISHAVSVPHRPRPARQAKTSRSAPLHQHRPGRQHIRTTPSPPCRDHAQTLLIPTPALTSLAEPKESRRAARGAAKTPVRANRPAARPTRTPRTARTSPGRTPGSATIAKRTTARTRDVGVAARARLARDTGRATAVRGARAIAYRGAAARYRHTSRARTATIDTGRPTRRRHRALADIDTETTRLHPIEEIVRARNTGRPRPISRPSFIRTPFTSAIYQQTPTRNKSERYFPKLGSSRRFACLRARAMVSSRTRQDSRSSMPFESLTTHPSPDLKPTRYGWDGQRFPSETETAWVTSPGTMSMLSIVAACPRNHTKTMPRTLKTTTMQEPRQRTRTLMRAIRLRLP